MPSILLGNASTNLSGQIVLSGNPYSGRVEPVGGMQLVLSPQSSGNAYVGLSGGMTMNSGGLLDGVVVAPGAGYFVPKIALSVSGSYNVYVHHDAAASGQGRLYFELY